MKITKIKAVKTPTRGTSKSAGLDFYIPREERSISILPHSSVVIGTGIKVKVPHNTCLWIANKGGIASKQQVIVGACIVDEDYQGEVFINLINTSNHPQTLPAETKIAQGLIVPVKYVDIEEVPEYELYDEVSERGEGKLGSTGLK